MIQKVSTSEAVVNHFKELIKRGELRPGDSLPSERNLQQELGISRFALREGLVKLNSQGIITINQGKSSCISEDAHRMALSDMIIPLFSKENPGLFEDLHDARSLLETEIVARAAVRVTEKDILTLKAILGNAASLENDPEGFGELDFAFHREIARISNNVFLQKMHELISDQVEEFLVDLSKCPGAQGKIIKEHFSIVEAMSKNDEGESRIVMQNHLKQCKNIYRNRNKN